MPSSVVSIRGQTVIPVGLRKKYKLEKDSKIEWIDIGNAILVLPLEKDIIEESFGMLKSAKVTISDLLRSREIDRKRDTAKIGMLKR